jgi:CRISPR-associated protein Cas2
MMILITYDVETSSTNGQKRLRRVAKLCKDYGQRVQNSVFECVLDSAQLLLLKSKLLAEIDEKADSLRFYRLGKHWETKVEHFGAKPSYNPEDVLIV